MEVVFRPLQKVVGLWSGSRWGSAPRFTLFVQSYPPGKPAEADSEGTRRS